MYTYTKIRDFPANIGTFQPFWVPKPEAPRPWLLTRHLSSSTCLAFQTLGAVFKANMAGKSPMGLWEFQWENHLRISQPFDSRRLRCNSNLEDDQIWRSFIQQCLARISPRAGDFPPRTEIFPAWK